VNLYFIFSPDYCRFFVARNVDIHAKSKNGRSPLEMAKEKAFDDCVVALTSNPKGFFEVITEFSSFFLHLFFYSLSFFKAFSYMILCIIFIHITRSKTHHTTPSNQN
jgi:hypothetical protein